MRTTPALALASTLVAAFLAAAPVRASAQGDRPLPWVGVRLGGVLAAASAASGTPTGGGGGAYALFDGREFLADVSVDAFGGTNAQFFAGGLGVYLPFVAENVTPYAGGGLKLGWTKFGGDGAFGLIPYAAAGVLFGRQGYIQIRAELSWFVALAGEEVQSRPGQSWHSSGPMLTLGLAF